MTSLQVDGHKSLQRRFEKKRDDFAGAGSPIHVVVQVSQNVDQVSAICATGGLCRVCANARASSQVVAAVCVSNGVDAAAHGLAGWGGELFAVI